MEHYVIWDKKLIFLVVLIKAHLSCYKGCKEILFFSVAGLDSLKSILDDAIVDIKMMSKFGLKHNFQILSI